MKPAAQIQATIELLDEVAGTRYPADRTMAQYFKQRRYIGSKDKATISEHFYTVLRNRLSFSYLLERGGVLSADNIDARSRLLLAVMLKIDGQQPRAFFNGEDYGPRRLTDKQLNGLENLDLDLASAPENVRLNVPEWIAAALKSSLGDRFEAEMTASNQRASTDIRVNTLKSDVDDVADSLSSVGYLFDKSELSPWGIRFNSRVALFALNAFKQGWFEVQDEGSQLLALATNAKPGQRVVDFCAGAGGKTLALAAMMQNKGVIYANDVHSKRLDQLSKRCKRAGVHNVRSHVLSSENDKWVKQHRKKADIVLIDAPCTGTGTWRRSPDSRWNLNEESLSNLVELQQSILQSASRLVKPGGRLFYATCSLLDVENEAQVAAFLSEHDEFSPCNLELPEQLLEQQSRFDLAGNQMRTYPGLTGTDGFFVAALRRNEEPEETDS